MTEPDIDRELVEVSVWRGPYTGVVEIDKSVDPPEIISFIVEQNRPSVLPPDVFFDFESRPIGTRLQNASRSEVKEVIL